MNRTTKLGRKITGLILAMVMLVTSYGSTFVMAADVKTLDVTTQVACAFQNDFSLVYYYKINTSGSFTNLALNVQFQKFSGSGTSATWETKTITNYTYDSTTKQYRFVFSGIGAPEMGNTVRTKLTAKIGSQAYESSNLDFSIKSYAANILSTKASSTKDEDKKLCTLMVDMLNYGAAAQTYFGINTGNLANGSLTSAQKQLASKTVTSASSCFSQQALSSATASIQQIALSFDNSVDLVAYVAFMAAPSDNAYAELTYTNVKGTSVSDKVYLKDFSYQQSNNLFRVAFKNLSALYFKTPLKIVIKDGGKAISATTTYSYESYASTILSGSYPTAMKNLVKYMLTYGNAAKAYQAVAGSGSSSGTVEVTPIDQSIRTYKNSKYTTDMPRCVIVIPEKATAEETYAAQLLRTYISKEDKYTPSIMKDTVAKGSQGFEISVGNTKNRAHGTPKYSSDGSYKIYSYDSGISITGVGKRGVIDGAAKFLSLCGGYYYLSFDDGYKTNQTHFKYATNINLDFERAFVFTDIDAAYGKINEEQYRMFDLANGLNGFFANHALSSSTPGYQTWYLYDPAKAANYKGIIPGQVHTLLFEYFSEDDFKVHPEWFSLWKGERQFKQLCLTNSQVYARIKKHVFEILEHGNYDPNAPMQIISLCQADNDVYCQCSNCQAFRNKYDTVDVKGQKDGLGDAGLYLDLCNRISKEVKKAGYTNVYIDMLAYTWNRKPPTGLSIDDHVIVRYAPIMRCYAHDCNSTECERAVEYNFHLKKWAELCKSGNAQLWIWDYNANWRVTIAPYLNIYSQISDIKYYKSLGVKGIYLQSNDRAIDCNTEFGDLRLYLGATLLQDPNADIEKEMDFFLNEYYGAGGPYVKEYLKILTKQAQNHQVGPNCIHNGYYYRDKVYMYDSSLEFTYCNDYGSDTRDMDAHNRMPDTEIAKCEELYNRAMAAVAGESERHKFTTERTFVSWRIIKSALRVYEFKSDSTLIATNKALYNDLKNKYGCAVFSLFLRKIVSPTDSYMKQNPGHWSEVLTDE